MEEAKGTILIVDDEESIRNIISRRLESEGYSCEVASDGKEALWKAFIKDFDLVLMDIKMPGMSGLEALPQMVTHHPDTCVLMLTAVIDADTAIEAMKLGAYDYVTKPFDLDDLTMRVDKALERRSLILEKREYDVNLEQKLRQQTEQMHQYYQEAIQALSREQLALEESEVESKPQERKASSGKETTAKPGEPSSPVKEFARKLSQLFSKEAPYSLDVKGEGMSAQAVAKREESQKPVASGEGAKQSSAPQNDTVELAIQSPVSLQHLLQLHDHLRSIGQIEVLGVEGAVDKDIKVRLLLRASIPLDKILGELPEVEKVSDSSKEAGSTAAVEQGESTPARLIVVELSQKPL